MSFLLFSDAGAIWHSKKVLGSSAEPVFPATIQGNVCEFNCWFYTGCRYTSPLTRCQLRLPTLWMEKNKIKSLRSSMNVTFWALSSLRESRHWVNGCPRLTLVLLFYFFPPSAPFVTKSFFFFHQVRSLQLLLFHFLPTACLLPH